MSTRADWLARCGALLGLVVVGSLVSAMLASPVHASPTQASPALASASRAAAQIPSARLAGERPAPVQPDAETARSQRADSPPPAQPPSGETRSPSRPPLTSEPSSDESAGVEAAGGSVAPQAEADPLVSNGLGSPLCQTALGGGALSRSGRSNCETSGFVAAPAQTGDFGVDVHIDTGLLGLSPASLLVAVQDLFIAPVWMALVWAMHALLVMLEWCFTLDLFDSASVRSGLARGLRQMQSAFTVPWLATVLAVASMLSAYNGLVRRRVAETLGQALLVLAMMSGGLWVMLDPSGTVGALGAWANQASLGTLAATARGAPAGAGRVLAEGMGTVFSAAIEVPWCYLEFGDVGWCRDTSRLDPRLRSAALAIASEAGARGDAAGEPHSSATLLRAARTNGAIFLALPANDSARNSINDPGSLLRAICQSESVTSCRGSAAPEAEFRANHGTWPRVGGLLLIVAGVLGMLLLLGFIALRLLTAALFSLLYLLFAPIVVLAPALGENGRAVFRKWGEQLLAAVVSKLLFSFLLGAVLVVLGILASLQALGWWTQWLLMSAFWWSAFVRRHQVLQLAGATRDGHERRALLQRVGDVVEPRRRLQERRREAKERRRIERLGDGAVGSGALREAMTARGARLPERGAASTDEAPGTGDVQALRMLAVARDSSLAEAGKHDATDARLAVAGARLERIRTQGAIAVAGGDTRRAASLSIRARRLEAETEGQREQLIGARRQAGDTAASASGGREQSAAGEERSHARFLDEQAALPSAAEAHRTRAAQRRDYVALAALAGYRPDQLQRLGAAEQRVARVVIDRELAARKQRPASADAQRSTSRALDRQTGHRAMPGARDALERRSRPPARPGRPPHSVRADVPESRVMRDAREVEAGRKRQLGYDEP
jgi:hypothetical protein